MGILYLFMIALLLWSFWKAVVKLRQRSVELTPILGWILGLAFFIMGPLTLIVLHGGYEIPSFYGVNDSYSKVDLSTGEFLLPIVAVWASLLFSFLVVILFAPDGRKPGEGLERTIDEVRLKKVLLITAGLGVFTYAAMIQMMGGLEVFLVSHWFKRQEELVGRLGDWYVLFTQLSLAAQVLFTAAAVLFAELQVKRREFHWRFSGLILFLFLLQIVMTGNRIFFGLYLLSLLASCWLHRRKRPIVIFLVVAPALIFIFSAWNYFRHNLSTIGGDVATYAEGDLGNRSITSLMDALEGNDTLILLHMINDFGSKNEYLYGGSYARILYFLVPRSIYPEKPPGFSLEMGALYEPGTGASLAVTQLGECWANFGPLTLLLFPLITIAILKLSSAQAGYLRSHALVGSTVFVLFIWIARSSFEDNFLTFTLAVALSAILGLEKGLSLRNLVTVSHPRSEPT
jgi:oligosaccharide repeat unit polymerase